MYKFIINEKEEKTAVVISIADFQKLQKELKANRERIEILEDKLDIKLAKKALESKSGKIPFNLKNYV
ncbi:MAG: hypothetical protein GX452_07320 [Ignavibacteriales bacterium]|jgi:hypothetical protein|nr:hypothetical protein [Ignavibacteriaceae bacterium]NLH61197.1 hypothetical protein [Ignavibacteriales bacterium]HPO55919.1 hypothetical protein [Ignavibacteriaceae bacterium]